jgi:hypothetical protein
MSAATVYSQPLAYHECGAPSWLRLLRRAVPLLGRPCEPGILVRCSICRHFWAPCTRTPVDMERVMDGVWRCSACAEVEL